MDKDSKILVVGHDDVIENSLFKYFQSNGYSHVYSATEAGLDTTIQASVYNFFSKNEPEYIFLASTRSGGIEANQKYPAEFIYHNLESQNNIVYSANKFGTKKILFYAGSCVYPKDGAQPLAEDSFLTGPLEESSEPYAIAKIAGVSLCQSYRRQHGLDAIVAVPATVYGPGSDTDLEKAHVMGALIAKFHEAAVNKKEEVSVWGSGKPRREFIFIDDFIEASLFLMDNYTDTPIINAGVGYDISIAELAELIKRITGFQGNIAFDESKPDGVQQKFLDSSRINQFGWKAKVSLEEGITKTYEWFKATKGA